MMKVLIVGAGGQGGACASILARQESVEEIRLVDLKEETAQAVAGEIGSAKVKTGAVNATDPDDEMCIRDRERYIANFEAHIEQGPILEDEGKDIGVVQCVLGMFNYRVKFHGFAAHAGTFPMTKRHDALYAASQALCYLHEEIDKLGRPELVYTTGEVSIHPCVHTVIPDYVDFSLDVRHEDPKVLEAVMNILKTLPQKEWAGCKCEIAEQWKRDTVYWDKNLVGFVQEAADELGISNMKINSGAGHDAQFVSYVLPTTMIFVQTKDGLSHCEPEFAKAEHCTEGASVLLNAILKADEFYK